MLTGGWADYNGIDDNGQTKDPDVKTFLTKIAETGRAVSFTTSWREHTATSYQPDIVSAIETGLPAEYTHQIDDAATYYQVLSYVAKPQGAEKTAKKDPDAIFFTFEHTDHAGHDTGFGNQNEAYVEACRTADSWGYEIIKTIEARSTYAQEDWLIIISTDHGGTGTSHGGQTPFERMTWLACNKAVAPAKKTKLLLSPNNCSGSCRLAVKYRALIRVQKALKPLWLQRFFLCLRMCVFCLPGFQRRASFYRPHFLAYFFAGPITSEFMGAAYSRYSFNQESSNWFSFLPNG